MNELLLFVAVSAVTIMTPGPGVVYTLTNSAQFGVRRSFPGIVGIALGTFLLSASVATGLGLVIASSAHAFVAIRYAGALYLAWLGIRLWCRPPPPMTATITASPRAGSMLLQGALIQLLNPQAILFFLAMLPQFVERSSRGYLRLAVLVTAYAVLVIVLHSLYGMLAGAARRWLATPRGARLVRRTAGGCFVLFGASLVSTHR